MLRKTLLALVAMTALAAATSSAALATTYPVTMTLDYNNTHVTLSGPVDYCTDGYLVGNATITNTSTGATSTQFFQTGPAWFGYVGATYTNGVPDVTFNAYPRGDGTYDAYVSTWPNFTFLAKGTFTITPIPAYSCRKLPAVTSADQCKGDGWKAVSSADDVAFKNQGDCVSYVTTKGKNAPAGT